MAETQFPLVVLSVHSNGRHGFSKAPKEVIRLIENWGVEGDAHAGSTDQHLYHRRKFGQTPNLRQVHLLQSETLAHLGTKGHLVRPGELGENISTQGVDLLALPTGTRLMLGPEAVIELTGLRSPCVKIEKVQPGLLQYLNERRPTGLVQKAGVMSIVVRGGDVKPRDTISITLPPLPHHPLVYVKPRAERA